MADMHRYTVVRDGKITSDTYEQITRDHPDYANVTTILRDQPDLLVNPPNGGSFLRVPDESVRLVHPDQGRPYLEVPVWVVEDGDIVWPDPDAGPVEEPDPRIIWID